MLVGSESQEKLGPCSPCVEWATFSSHNFGEYTRPCMVDDSKKSFRMSIFVTAHLYFQDIKPTALIQWNSAPNCKLLTRNKLLNQVTLRLSNFTNQTKETQSFVIQIVACEQEEVLLADSVHII